MAAFPTGTQWSLAVLDLEDLPSRLDPRRLDAALRRDLLPSWPDEAALRDPDLSKDGWGALQGHAGAAWVGSTAVWVARSYRRPRASKHAVRAAVETRKAYCVKHGLPWGPREEEDFTKREEEATRRSSTPTVRDVPILLDFAAGRLVVLGATDAAIEGLVSRVRYLIAGARGVEGLNKATPHDLASHLLRSRGAVGAPSWAGSRFLQDVDARSGRWLQVANGPVVGVRDTYDAQATVAVESSKGVVRAKGSGIAVVHRSLMESGDDRVQLRSIGVELWTTAHEAYRIGFSHTGAIRTVTLPRLERSVGVAEHLVARCASIEVMLQMVDAMYHAFDVGPLSEALALDPQRPLYESAPTCAGVRWTLHNPTPPETRGQLSLVSPNAEVHP